MWKWSNENIFFILNPEWNEDTANWINLEYLSKAGEIMSNISGDVESKFKGVITVAIWYCKIEGENIDWCYQVITDETEKRYY